MHFAQAIGLLVVVTIAIAVLRFNWYRLPAQVEKYLLPCAAITVALRIVFLATQWNTVSIRFNALLSWLAVIGYELILARFSLMRPQWLTSLSAIILIPPMLGSTLLLPLTNIFETETAEVRPITKNYLLERNPWDAAVVGKNGSDYGIYYRPTVAPFLRHLVQRSSLGAEQCNDKEVTVRIDPNNKLVHFHCPGHHGDSDSVELTLPMK